MNVMRKAVCFLFVMMFAAIALPTLAAPQYTKQYSLTLTSSPSTALTVVADLTNLALGPGNANVGSTRLTFTGATIALVTAKILPTNTVIPPTNISLAHNPDGPSVFILLGTTPLKAGQTLQITIVLNDCGDGISLPESGVQVWTGNMGQTFAPDATTLDAFPLTASVVCGVFACGDSGDVPISGPNAGSVTVTRGIFDKNGVFSGAACAGIPYTYTSFDADATACQSTSAECQHFAYPLDNPASAWSHTIYSDGPLPAAGTTGLAWKDKITGDPVTDNPDFVTGNDFSDPAALDCLEPKILPTPYGTLVGGIGDSDLSITVDVSTAVGAVAPIAHPTPPFETVIGTERIRVSSTVAGLPGQEIWTVPSGGRGVWGTTVASHNDDAVAMSTPLPILPITVRVYAQDTQALACIAAQAYDSDTDIHSTTFISVGPDPWTSQP